MKLMFYKRFLCLIILVCFNAIYSQNDSTDYLRPETKKVTTNQVKFKDRIYWGGNVGAWIGNPTFVDVSPLIGIRITNKFSAGIGVIYNYYSYSYSTVCRQTNVDF